MVANRSVASGLAVAKQFGIPQVGARQGFSKENAPATSRGEESASKEIS